MTGRDRRDRVARREILAGDMGMLPYRAPHHTASGVALVGGGSNPRLAKSRSRIAGCCSSTNCPSGIVACSRCSRAARVGRDPYFAPSRQCTFPAEFQFVAAMNPCPCGGSVTKAGAATAHRSTSRATEASCQGPLLDRIDLGVEVPAVAVEALAGRPTRADREEAAGASAPVRTSITDARQRQIARQGKPNARLAPREVDAHCTPDAAGAALLAQAMAHLSLSARAYHRILKVARTIADYADIDAIGAPHIAEAVGYRRFDRI